eukprot:Hpha_TRINITY_DN23089_c0_g1::TRINITY_DN23089_c0_g1_i1::g.109325::m.109325
MQQKAISEDASNFVDSQPEGFEAGPPVGKPELLRWIAGMTDDGSGTKPPLRFSDLKDGAIILRVLASVFPNVEYTLEKVQWFRAPENREQIEHNWDTVETLLRDLHVPAAALDKQGVAQAKFKPTFQLCLTLFVLEELAQAHSIQLNFAHEIDSPLKKFLVSSTECAEVLRLGGALYTEEDVVNLDMSADGDSPRGEEGERVFPRVYSGVTQPSGTPREPALVHQVPSPYPMV